MTVSIEEFNEVKKEVSDLKTASAVQDQRYNFLENSIKEIKGSLKWGSRWSFGTMVTIIIFLITLLMKG